MRITNELRVTGRVLEPGDNDFDQARKPWNLAIEQPVRAVVEAADADDVAAVVSFARTAGLAVTAQPSGHGATGNTDGVILLRTQRLNDLNIHPAKRLARVGAGVQWGQVLAAAGPHGLTGLAGSSPVVSVTGYTLGGGLSWFGRKHGWASDSVRAFDIVDADGVRARVTADSDPDLFWALRGGGGDFALVTAIEFDLHPAPELYGGRMLWPADRAPRVLEAFREITSDAPDELTVWLDLLRFPGAQPLVAMDTTYLGDPAEAHPLLRRLEKIDGLISDSRAPMPMSELGAITAEPTDPGPGLSRAELLTDLDEDALLSAPIDPLISVQIRHLGGALARPSDSAAGHLDEPYALYMFGLPSPATRTRQQEITNTQNATGRKPLTLLTPGENVSAAFDHPTLTRLQQIKKHRDPQNVIRSNYPVLTGTTGR